MSADVLLFGALPNAALIGAVILALYRTVARPVTLVEPLEMRSDERLRVWGVTPLQWGLGIILAVDLVAVLLPDAIRPWTTPPRLYLVEGAMLAVALFAALGYGTLLYRYLFTEQSEEPIHWADVLVVVFTGLFIGSGLVTALFYRFFSAWGLAILVPYVRGIATGAADTALIGDLPLAAQLHVLSFFALLPALPLSRFARLLAVPVHRVRSFWDDLMAARERGDAAGVAGSRLSWGKAYGFAVVFLVGITLLTVWLPSRIMKAMGTVAEPIPSIVASGVWFVFLAAAIVGLRWTQKSGRI